MGPEAQRAWPARPVRWLAMLIAAVCCALGSSPVIATASSWDSALNDTGL